MRETPRPQGTAGDAGPELPQRRPGRAFAHTAGASGSGTPHRSDGRSPQTPRGVRQTGPTGRPGTTPPVPGRPALLLFLVLPLLALFALTTWQIAADGPLRGLDERAGRAVVGHGPAGLTEFLADLGNMQVALPVLGCALVLALVRGARRAPSYAALTMGAVPLLVVPLKDWIARPGPLTDATGYYPSGHAATAAVAYGAAALLLAPYAGRPWSWMTPVAAVLLTTATGIGLVLRGYHWPLDVLGSWFLCGILLLPLGLSCRSRRRSSSRTPRC
ncbi:phosphatase PAP2 family protein [Streptomyces sp. NBC_01435]|uniref:phosphatase PAP2 family protein n=1 Tax=Streptomyces sp. NBC_01435 TaxID=2903865 RepID=UPI002E2EBB68|nr:phosphatase PAP2 family protein [Streptomyces sp. NBC_01435]